MNGIAKCKNRNPVISIYGVTSEHIYESIGGNKMKLDTLIDGHQRKCRVQAKVPERPSVRPSVRLELSPLLILWMYTLYVS